MADVVTLLPAGTAGSVTGASVDAGDLKDEAAMQVIVSGTLTALNVQLQGSLDNVNWFNIGANFTTLTGGEVAVTPASAAGFVARYFRATTGTITGGTITAKLAFAKS